MADALVLSGIYAGYGETHVLEDLSLSIEAGASLSVIGRNGVGKSTLLATIMGATDQHGGSIHLFGQEISRLPIHRRVGVGLGYVPQEREIFPSLSVQENLTVGSKAGEWTIARILELFPNLASRLDNMGNQLSGGEQQMLSIARALMGQPKVLLMDEPSEGLAPIIVEELVRVMKRLREDGGMTVVLVEQNPRVALDFSERTIVLDRGRIVHDGASEELATNKELLDRMIGVAQG